MTMAQVAGYFGAEWQTRREANLPTKTRGEVLASAVAKGLLDRRPMRPVAGRHYQQFEYRRAPKP